MGHQPDDRHFREVGQQFAQDAISMFSGRYHIQQNYCRLQRRQPRQKVFLQGEINDLAAKGMLFQTLCHPFGKEILADDSNLFQF